MLSEFFLTKHETLMYMYILSWTKEEFSVCPVPHHHKLIPSSTDSTNIWKFHLLLIIPSLIKVLFFAYKQACKFACITHYNSLYMLMSLPQLHICWNHQSRLPLSNFLRLLWIRFCPKKSSPVHAWNHNLTPFQFGIQICPFKSEECFKFRSSWPLSIYSSSTNLLPSLSLLVPEDTLMFQARVKSESTQIVKNLGWTVWEQQQCTRLSSSYISMQRTTKQTWIGLKIHIYTARHFEKLT